MIGRLVWYDICIVWSTLSARFKCSNKCPSFLPSFLPSLLRTYVCPYRWMDDADGFIPFRPLCVLLCVGVPLITFENVRYPSNDSRLEYDHNIHVSVPVRGCTLSNTPNLCSEPDRSRSNLKYSTDCYITWKNTRNEGVQLTAHQCVRV